MSCQVQSMYTGFHFDIAQSSIYSGEFKVSLQCLAVCLLCPVHVYRVYFCIAQSSMTWVQHGLRPCLALCLLGTVHVCLLYMYVVCMHFCVAQSSVAWVQQMW